MISLRARRIGRREADELLSGGSSRADRAGIVEVLELAAAPPHPEELAGRQAAVAAFARAWREGPAAPVRRGRLRAWLSRALAVKAITVLALLSLGGVAVAAGTGTLPAGVQHGAHDLLTPFGVPVPDASSAHGTPTRPATPHRSASPAPAPGSPAASADPAVHGLCEAWQAGQTNGQGKKVDAAVLTRLSAAAGGTEKIPAFCAAVLAPPPSPTTGPPAAPGGPPPSHPGPDKTHGKPSRIPQH